MLVAQQVGAIVVCSFAPSHTDTPKQNRFVKLLFLTQMLTA